MKTSHSAGPNVSINDCERSATPLLAGNKHLEFFLLMAPVYCLKVISPSAFQIFRSFVDIKNLKWYERSDLAVDGYGTALFYPPLTEASSECSLPVSDATDLDSQSTTTPNALLSHSSSGSYSVREEIRRFLAQLIVKSQVMSGLCAIGPLVRFMEGEVKNCFKQH
ncbi:hypothetical protein [Microbulbifer sp. TYP-18]|uniref:hypothetical protein n=1 Tax=Microbulbifer sp. TYP-18 TaxID=3230024 RepID=UPI0034C6DE4E